MAATIMVDGSLYTIRSLASMRRSRGQRIAKDARRLRRLMEREERQTLTHAEEAELSALLDRICRAVLPAPADVHARLQDLHRLRITQAFIASWPSPQAGTVEKPYGH